MTRVFLAVDLVMVGTGFQWQQAIEATGHGTLSVLYIDDPHQTIAITKHFRHWPTGTLIQIRFATSALRADDNYPHYGTADCPLYKRLDYAVRTFARNGRKLKLVGEGPEYKALRKLAGPNVEFCGRVSDEELQELYARSAALIVPGEEDFGMTMVESLASGKPVLAFGRGGAVEIVRDKCGVLYEEASEGCLAEGLRTFDRMEAAINPLYLRTAAADFSDSVFEQGFRGALARLLGRAGNTLFERNAVTPLVARSLAGQ